MPFFDRSQTRKKTKMKATAKKMMMTTKRTTATRSEHALIYSHWVKNEA